MRILSIDYLHATSQFHFATILSPWIRRALIAGGFGTGERSRVPAEVISVVPYHDLSAIEDPESIEKSDIENVPVTRLRRGTSAYGTTDAETLSLENTPYFHFDVVAAVRIAEGNVMNSIAVASTDSVSVGKRRSRD
jgi:solute carrier family 26 (sodium-independent sulfate anion transporter), member 11